MPKIYNLARMYKEGEGVAQNYPESLRWYEQTAEAGNKDAPMKCQQVRELMKKEANKFKSIA